MSKMNSKDSYFSKKSLEYENALADSFKKNNGIFYTDMELANSVVKFLRIPKKSSVIDPSCGSGSFIRALSNAKILDVTGCDFDQNTVEKCKELTGIDSIYTADTLGNDGEAILESIGKDKFDYVIGNPPYAPLNGGAELRGDCEFRKQVKDSGNNLFVAAVYRAFELAKENGYVSFIIPKNLLHISSYAMLRKILLNEKRLVSIIELGIHFKTVRGEQIVLTFQNKFVKGNKIKFYNYNKGTIEFMSEVPQSYYEDEIIVFTSNDEVSIYDKLRMSYGKLEDVCVGDIHRGHNRAEDAIRGKQIRKFGFKDLKVPKDGTHIFIQNIFSAEAGITASFAGNMIPNETVTMLKLESKKMSKYILGLLHSRVCNYYLIRFGFNNSRLTIHTDAKYLNGIPIVVDRDCMDEMVEIVTKMEAVPYMEEEWFSLNEKLNRLVYQIYELPEDEQEYIEQEMRKISASKWYGSVACSA